MEVSKCLDTLDAGKGNITCVVNAIDSNTELSALRGVNQRKATFMDYLSEGTANSNLTTKEHQQVLSFLEDYHNLFSLDDGNRGKTDLVEMTIDMGNAVLKKQAARRTPFAVRHKVAVQLQKMLEQNVIQPSCSPWASPIVLV